MNRYIERQRARAFEEGRAAYKAELVQLLAAESDKAAQYHQWHRLETLRSLPEKLP